MSTAGRTSKKSKLSFVNQCGSGVQRGCNVDPETSARDESNHSLGPGLNPNTGKDEKDGDQPRKIGEKQVLV